MLQCPCGSKIDYQQCCAPLIEGKSLPTSPEALMRSRYTAYTQANMEYIDATMRGEAAQNFSIEQARQAAKQTKWLGLKVLAVPHVAAGATVGYVEFSAEYIWQGKMLTLHEVSEFHLLDGRWFYVKGTAPTNNPVAILKHNKVSRNETCPCGSGKKYKKCCALCG